ncbi:hypothetical protein GCM10027570_42180 [Streptomonospora sediminis]
MRRVWRAGRGSVRSGWVECGEVAPAGGQDVGGDDGGGEGGGPGGEGGARVGWVRVVGLAAEMLVVFFFVGFCWYRGFTVWLVRLTKQLGMGNVTFAAIGMARGERGVGGYGVVSVPR